MESAAKACMEYSGPYYDNTGCSYTLDIDKSVK